MMPSVPPELKPTIKRNLPLITFFSRTWILFIFMLLSNYLVLWQHHFGEMVQEGVIVNPGWTLFEKIGAVMYVPALGSAVFWFYLLMLHLFFRETLDKDAHNGTYITDWRALSSGDRMWMNVILRVGFFIGFCILFASAAKGAEPDQVARWSYATINPHWSIALDCNVAIFKRNMTRYEAITKMRTNGVPATIIFGLHQRESSGNFRCHPHEGSPLTGRTRYIPKGRLPLPDKPPFTFEQSAVDAYYVVDRLDKINWSDLQDALQGIESFNGLGYQNYHPDVPSPYLWNGLLINGKATRGKYTGDGRFDRTATDQQLGVAAILMRLKQAGYKCPWDAALYIPLPPTFDQNHKW